MILKDLKVIRVIKDKKSPFTELQQQASAINLLYCRAAKAEEPAYWSKIVHKIGAID